MGVRSPERDEGPPPPRLSPGPPFLTRALLALVLLIALVSNGRPIGAGDTRPTERVAASLVTEADFDLDEHPDVEEPFARAVAEHRVSIYPVLSAVLAAPVFAAARLLFAFDETGLALAGKWAASLLSCLAAAVLFTALGRRHPHEDAAWAAAAFALGTSVWSTSQALWQHPAAVLALCVVLLFLVQAEDDDVWAARAGLPLGLAVAARHADVALAAVLAIGIAIRWPRRIPWLIVWAAPVVLFVLVYQWAYFGSPWAHGFAGGLGRFSEPWGRGHLGLLVSPAKGLLVFTPLVIVAVAGLVRAFRRGDRWLATTLGAAAAAHWLLLGRWSEWHGGESWGPRLMTDALPLLFLFLPEGINLWPRAAAGLGIFCVAVQALGAFAYDYRWERLYQRGPGVVAADALWDVAKSPIPFYVQRRVVYLAVPAVEEGRAVVREHPMVLGGPEGSHVRFGGEDPAAEGADPTLQDVHLQRGARVEGTRLRMRGRWDGLFLRVREAARKRRLELRLAGRGQGILYVGERSFWSGRTRWSTYPVSGAFQVRHPYDFATSGGPDITVTVGKGGGEIDLESASLVPPTEPANPIRVR